MRTKFSLEELTLKDDLEDRAVEGETVKLDFTEIGLEGLDWIYLAQ
jgi:hypothetical protein